MLAVLAALALGQTPAPAPTENVVLTLRNVAAADVAASLKTTKTDTPFVVTPEPISNTLLISGTAADVVRVVKQINELDVPPLHYMFDIRICTGDPLGSRAAGTQKVISEPKVVVKEGATGFVRAGGQAVLEADGEPVAIGVEMKVVVLSMKGEMARVRIEGANTTLEGPEKERSLKTVRSFATREVKAGEVTRFRIGQPADAVWAEVTVRPVQAMPNYQVPPFRPQPAK